jgi:hypothetical protein
MIEEKFTYTAENGNVCEIVDTFAEMFARLEISPANSPFFWCKIGQLFSCRCSDSGTKCKPVDV